MPSAIAKIDDVVLADSDETIIIEGNHYFPKASVNFDLLTPTDYQTVCHWKGNANYFTISVDGKEYDNAAWTYHDPLTDPAKPIKDYVAFYSNIVDIQAKQ